MNEAPEYDQNRPIFDHAGGSRMVRGLAVMLAVVVLIAVAISACGTASQVTSGTTAAGTFATTTAPGFDKGGLTPETTIPPILPTGTIETSSGTRPSNVPVKIIRNASLDLEAADVEKTYQDLLSFAAARGGYEAARRLATNAGYATIEARIKIAPQYLDEFLSHAGNTATVINVQTTSQDVTESYYDVQTRLKTMEQMLAKYTDFLNRAANVNEALSVQAEINRLTTEIESLKGRLRFYDSQVAESTITLVIRERKDPVRTTRDVRWNALTLEDMWYLMQRGLVTVANTVTNILQWLVIAIVALSPLLIIALIAWLIVRKRRGPRPPHDDHRGRHGRSAPGDRFRATGTGEPGIMEGRSDDGAQPGEWRRSDGPGSTRPQIQADEPLIPPQPDEPPTPPAPPAPTYPEAEILPPVPDEPTEPLDESTGNSRLDGSNEQK